MVALESFVKKLEDSGIVTRGQLEKFVPPQAFPRDVDELVAEMVRQKQLTAYQVEEISQGRAESLILGNYTILDRIGSGGMGQVFKAEHRRMKRVVAIKTLLTDTIRDAAITRFQREVEAAARLLHPNIVSAFDADEADGIHFLVMEYVEGSDLSTLVKKEGPLPVARAADFILQVARGLQFAHAAHVVHRDIKPANLLVDQNGTVKILDMGLVRIESSADAATQAELTDVGSIMGTMDYMAPEQALSTKNADARADIYSLGCTWHYLLTGKAMYAGDTQTAKLVAHREQPIPRLRDIRTDVSAQAEAVFRKMVAKTVADRYQTMSEVVAELERCALPPRSVAAATPDESSRSAADRRDNKVKLGMVAAVLLALAAAVVVVIAQRAPNGDAATNKPAPIPISSGPGPSEPAVPPLEHRDREIANWALSLGGIVDVGIRGNLAAPTQAVVDSSKLPTGDLVVRGIDFRKCRELKDDQIARLTPLTELTSLTFVGTAPSDDGLVHLGRIGSLESLSIVAGFSVTDNGLRSLQSLLKLKTLRLTSRIVAEQDAAVLASLPGLTNLEVYGITSDDVLDALGSPPKWKSFTVGPGMGLSNQGLKTIGQWRELTTLSFSSKLVDDGGLEHLAGLKNLKTLLFSNTSATPAGIAVLRAALPDCKIAPQ